MSSTYLQVSGFSIVEVLTVASNAKSEKDLRTHNTLKAYQGLRKSNPDICLDLLDQRFHRVSQCPIHEGVRLRSKSYGT